MSGCKRVNTLFWAGTPKILFILQQEVMNICAFAWPEKDSDALYGPKTTEAAEAQRPMRNGLSETSGHFFCSLPKVELHFKMNVFFFSSLTHLFALKPTMLCLPAPLTPFAFFILPFSGFAGRAEACRRRYHSKSRFLEYILACLFQKINHTC